MRVFIIGLTTIIVLYACVNNKHHKDTYYTDIEWGEFRPRIPLYEPLAIYKDRIAPNKWFLSFDDLKSKKRNLIKYNVIGASIDSIDFIGVENHFVYGCIYESRMHIKNYDQGEFVIYSYEWNSFSLGLTTPILRENEVIATMLDSVNKIFLLPERWFIINTQDTTLRFYSTKQKYSEWLQKNNILGNMYNIDSIYYQFTTKGVLPWFPDSIKVTLR